MATQLEELEALEIKLSKGMFMAQATVDLDNIEVNKQKTMKNECFCCCHVVLLLEFGILCVYHDELKHVS